MIDRLLDLLTGHAERTSEEPANDLELSVAALLIEAARMDDKFDAGERAVIEHLLARSFSLDSGSVQSLIEKAERVVRRSAQYFPFTQQICRHANAETRIQIIEMLWKVAYSDGTLDPHEDALIRQIAGLIQVPDRERGAARKKALEKLAATTEPSSRSGKP
jgi:uncharacterized tellurite resistance protein B-like protein